MSTTKTVVLIVTAVLVVCLIGAGIVLATGFDGSFAVIPGMLSGKPNVKIDEAQDLDLSGIDEIKVECVSGEVIVEAGDPKVELKGNITTDVPKEKYLAVEKNGSELIVRYDANTTFPGFISGHVKMRVWLPENLNVDLSVSGASSEISVIGLSVEDLSASSASGSISVKDCEGEELSASSVSGTVILENTGFESTEASSTSGSVYAKNIGGEISAENVSGSVRIENVDGKVIVSNTSGSAYVSQPQKNIDQISIETISGSAKVELNPEAAFELEVSSTSGSLDTDFEIKISGKPFRLPVGERLSGSVNGGGVTVQISTVSGSIQIEKK